MPMPLRLWLDDDRPIPDGYNAWARDAAAGITALEEALTTGRHVEIVSFDHDIISTDGQEFRPVMRWIAEHDAWPDTVRVHTGSSIGAEWLLGITHRYAPESTTVIDARATKQGGGAQPLS
jgi:hypothetical protein